jgi:hypothetical protein
MKNIAGGYGGRSSKYMGCQINQQRLKLCESTYPLEERLKKDLILLLVSPKVGVDVAEGSGVQSEENRGSDAWAK